MSVNEHEKLEKVIMGLEMSYTYSNVDGSNTLVPQQLLLDALALLKAQEARVLALDEIHCGMAVWLEDVDKADVILAIGGSSAGGAKCFITENDTSIAPLSAEYGIRWRAWTAEPTDEQREAEPWS